MTFGFRMPHRADSFWQAISDGDKSFFEQITEENNRAVEDHIATATRNNGAYFIAVWDTSDSADPVLTSTTNCTEASSVPGGVGAVFADTLGIYTVHATHTVSGNGTVDIDDSPDVFPGVRATNGTASGTYLTGEASGEAVIVVTPGTDTVGAWTGTLTLYGFKVGEAGDLF